MPPFLSSLEVGGVAAIAGADFFGVNARRCVFDAQIPGDTKTLLLADCPKQTVLREIPDGANVAIPHRYHFPLKPS